MCVTLLEWPCHDISDSHLQESETQKVCVEKCGKTVIVTKKRGTTVIGMGK